MRKAITVSYLCLVLAIVLCIVGTIVGYRDSEMYTAMIPTLMAVVALLAMAQVAYSRKNFEDIRKEIDELNR